MVAQVPLAHLDEVVDVGIEVWDCGEEVGVLEDGLDHVSLKLMKLRNMTFCFLDKG